MKRTVTDRDRMFELRYWSLGRAMIVLLVLVVLLVAMNAAGLFLLTSHMCGFR